MTIREYFDNILNTTDDFAAYCDAQDELYTLCENEDFDLQAWADEHGVDLTATKLVHGEEIPVVTLWFWDMEG